MNLSYLVIEAGEYVAVDHNERLAVIRGPDILLRAELLHLGERTEEGRVVNSPAVPWFEIQKVLRSNPLFRFEFTRSPRKFEELIAGTYRQSGWEQVILTPASGDRGRDVIASNGGLFPARILEQAKAYSARRRVTRDEVNAIYGVKCLDPRATACGITTTSDFAPRIQTAADLHRLIPHVLRLTNGDEFVQQIASLSVDGVRKQ